ncbi:MAG: AfsR/SARP family transcriptional regulator [Ilumatobacteraceae bacterium]
MERSQIDAIRFEDLLAGAPEPSDDPHRCLEVCAEGLALWRGDPFGDFVDDEPFRLESARLGELRVSMNELALECEVMLGHPDIAAAELESAVAEYPYRERLWYLLIDALARDGRRVEALRMCHRLREVLGSAGLEPGERLTRVEHEILTDTRPDAGFVQHRNEA